MPAEIVVNFHNGTDTVGGNANDISPLNTSNVNLTDYNTGSDSGWDMVSSDTFIASSSGRTASVGGAPSYYSTINAEGNYFNTLGGAAIVTLSNIPSNVTAFDITMFLCTTFSSQTNMRVDCEAEFNTGWDSTNNTTGATFTLAGCVPDVSNEAAITLDNVTSTFTFVNGFHIDNVQETSAGRPQGPLTHPFYGPFRGPIS